MLSNSQSQGHWCEFCQMYHSSMTCFHPGNIKLLQLEADNAALRKRVAKWENWKPDNDDLLTMREQAESAKSLAAYAAYVGMLEYKYREQQERVEELEAEIAELKQDRTTGAGYQTFTVAR